jgi:hypothetical protein
VDFLGRKIQLGRTPNSEANTEILEKPELNNKKSMLCSVKLVSWVQSMYRQREAKAALAFGTVKISLPPGFKACRIAEAKPN